MIKFIKNIEEYFSPNYFDEDFAPKVFAKTGYNVEVIKELNKKITPINDKFFRFKRTYIEDKLRIKDKIAEGHKFHTQLLNALGYEGERTQYDSLFHLSEQEVIPVRQILYRGTQPHLMIMEMQALIKEEDTEPDGLFQQCYNVTPEYEQSNPPQRYHRSQWSEVFSVPEGLKISPMIINKAISELFLLEQHLRPNYILLLAGNVIFLLAQEKWFRGSYLSFDLEELFSEATANRNANYYALLYSLLGKENLAPDSNIVLLDQLDEDNHKSAYEVTKDLKEGIIYAVEALANEALWYHHNKQALQENLIETDDQFEQDIKDDCLRMIYRLLFIFYAESRQDLDILPSNDAIYNKGYSLEMLRDLEQVPLYSENSLNGYFFHESLQKLFAILHTGYREDESTNNKSFKVRHIDSPIFDDKNFHYFQQIKFRNKVWQDIICRLSLSKQKHGRNRGRISYANLGINQLGSVYESLLAYRGFYAEQDYLQVHKKDSPKEGTYLVPRSRRDEFAQGEILTENYQDVILPKGTFVYRLSGRDRQKSASYYTPEVLTQCTVKYTLKPLLEKVEKGEVKAIELLELKLLEPAMGAAAFHNEMINQLAEAYLSYRQKELRDYTKEAWKIEPDKYKEELQKVKAHIATHNVYGVDLNPTAIELGKLSLWLNVIHKDMETPFFSNRICVGNAVVGAWLKVYAEKDLSEEYHTFLDAKGKTKKELIKKEWWEKSPKSLEFKPNKEKDKLKTDRKENEIYHFLLFDKQMLASANLQLLKAEYPRNSASASTYKREWTKPLSKTEISELKQICAQIDNLLGEYYRFQCTINEKTASRQQIFGATKKNEQALLPLSSYSEKERLADERNRRNAPYFKLKLIFDYWCSLWFWDVRETDALPTRQQYWQDIREILQLDTDKALEGVIERKGQQAIFEAPPQLSFALEQKESFDTQSLFTEAVQENIQQKDLFDNNQRLKCVEKLAKQYHFFHPQLEFLEVFWERGGFDLIAGNPPWLKLIFEEKSIISEKFPEVNIRNVSAPEVRKLQNAFFQDTRLKEMYWEELIGTECVTIFMNAHQNYPLLKGQQTNLYKCVLENGFSLLSKQGFMGLLHPEGVYDDPNGQPLRTEMYQRLEYHFQFRNQLKLFAEVGDRFDYGIHIYSGKVSEISFQSINNLFHPSTINGCFIHNGKGLCGGIKVKGEGEEGFVWNILPHKERIVYFNEDRLRILAKTFENTEEGKTAKLVSIHSDTIIRVLIKFRTFNKSLISFEPKITVCFDETNDVNKRIIKRSTQFPNIENYEMVYSGPHIFTANPLYKTPKEICTEKAHYDIIEPTQISKEYIARTNYIPDLNENLFPTLIKGFKTGQVDKMGNDIYDNWIDYYKIAFRAMLNQAGERTLIGAILPRKSSHINTVKSIIFKDSKVLLEFASLTSSIILDFYIKTTGKAGLYDNALFLNMPLGVENKYVNLLINRTLQLNCLNQSYAPLWSENWDLVFGEDSWSKTDARLSDFSRLSSKWEWATPLRNSYERRQALVEIDVISAMALGLSLAELSLIYQVQFPVLQQNEEDTWYDQKGNIVFTCSKGLVGVGLDRPIWEKVRHLSAGETYTHTIEKSELYKGKQITYFAPFDKCDRISDYALAWAHFEKLF